MDLVVDVYRPVHWQREREREIDRAREQTERHPGPEEWNEAKR